MSSLHSTLLLLLAAVFALCHLQLVAGHVIHANVTDDVAPGRVIADVRKSLESRYESSVLNQLSYVLLSHNPLFHIDSSSGLIRSVAPLDRDRLCPSQQVCVQRIDVAVHPAAYFTKIKVLVNLDDVNDNAPVFPTPRVHFNLSEATSTRSVLPLQAAVDADSPQNGVVRYILHSDSDLFDLNVSRGDDGSFDLQLVLVKPLDRETADSHQLVVTAFDGGTPERSGTLVIDISVTDVNDNSPRFEQPLYEVEVSENVDVSRGRKLLLTVQATDSDAGLNGRVTYRLSPKTLATYGDMFQVDRHTGHIYLTTSLDYEEYKTISLDIIAEDSGSNSRPVLCRVNVIVQDVNDNSPTIELIPTTVTTERDEVTWLLNVTEHSPARTHVGHVLISDMDSDGQQIVTCSLAETGSKQHFLLVEKFSGSYAIMTSDEPIDREMTSRHRLTMTCTDEGMSTSLSSKIHVIITVDDVNDHAPVFTQAVYNVTVRENSKPLEMVVQVTATDVDSGGPSSVVYSLVAAGPAFDIDRNSGLIWTNMTFDREYRDLYEFYVTATNTHMLVTSPPQHQSRDQVLDHATSTATVIVRVLDINDQAPHFTQHSYTFYIAENQASGSSVGNLTAFDLDLPSNNRNTFQLVESPSAPSIGGVFGLDRRTGQLTTRRPLDREQQDVYRFKAVVQDELNHTMKDSCDVIVHVTDENDQTPVVRFPAPPNDTVYVSNTAAVGNRLTRIDAVDLDSGLNGRLQYILTQGNEHSLFRIDAKTGEIFLNGSLEQFIALDTFQLIITVQDAGTPSRWTQTTLFVKVGDASHALGEVSEAEQQSIISQILDIPVAGTKLVVLVGILFGVLIVLLTVCITATCLYKRQRREKRLNKQATQPSPSSSVNTSSTTSPPPPAPSDLVCDLDSLPPRALTPVASSIGSSGQGRGSSAATASVFLEEEEWDTIPRLAETLCRRSIGPGMLPPRSMNCYVESPWPAAAVTCSRCEQSDCSKDCILSSPVGPGGGVVTVSACSRYEPCPAATTYCDHNSLHCGPADTMRLPYTSSGPGVVPGYGTGSRIGSRVQTALDRGLRCAAASVRKGNGNNGNSAGARIGRMGQNRQYTESPAGTINTDTSLPPAMPLGLFRTTGNSTWSD